MTERVCNGCGGSLPTMHGNRKFCSEHCRRKQYAGKCIDCGVATNGHDGPGKASDRCVTCANRHIIDIGRADMARARAKRERVQRLWAEGLLMREIAAEMGWSMGYLACEMNRMRKAGYDMPHRYRSYGERWDTAA
jgi:hypothetical protein